MDRSPFLRRVVSGGQTGVDQAALRAARAAGLAIGGFCPPGRVCDGGTIPADLPLVETPEERSPRAPDVPRSLRTEWNVRDADATLILDPAPEPDPGTAFAAACARRLGRPAIAVDPAAPGSVERVAAWIRACGAATLHVAGPSEAARPGVGASAYRLLLAVFGAGAARADESSP